MLQESSASQLEGAIAREVYLTIEPDNPGYRSDLDDLQGYEEIGKGLLARLASIRDQLTPIEPSSWLGDFRAACEARDLELRQTWREKWNVLANGKGVLNEIYKQVGPTCSELEFKRRIAIEMKVKTTETWRVVDNVLSSALQT